MKIIGIDASLTSTGVAALYDRDQYATWAIQSKLTGPDRLIEIRDILVPAVREADIVVIEGYAFARLNQAHQIGELGGVLRVMFRELRVRWIEVAPSQVKKFCTGKGNATKEQMAAWVQKRWNKMFPTNDETDAWVLAQIGKAVLGDREGLTAYQLEIVEELSSGKAKRSRKKAG